nr:YccS family putative transporter [Acinetobacter lanii]
MNLKSIAIFKANSTLLYCLQMLIVLSGTTLGLLFLGFEQLIVPITLGAIAAALTDFDDRLSLRLRNLSYVCVLFFAVSSILDLLHPYKLLFLIYLSLSSAALMLMGALGPRYATISFGTVLLSIYTMFGLGEYAAWYLQPSYFVCGALWYGLTSILFYLLKPTQAVQDNLAACFNEIATLLFAKAKLFDPDNKANVEQLLYEVSLQNSQVVHSLNQSKASLMTRLKASRANQNTIYWLNLYFFAQDMHEQTASNYLHYEHIQHNFSRTDLIYRFQKNIRLQALNCQALAQSILNQHVLRLPLDDVEPLANLEHSLAEWIQQNPQNMEVKNLGLVLSNLRSVHQQFAHLAEQQSLSTAHKNTEIQHSIDPTHSAQDNFQLLDDDLHSAEEVWYRLKQNLSPQSALFRHAVRIAFVFAVGYAISLLPFAKNGYWILLTSLFVCQISYFATKSRLKMRTLGTLLGVLLGIPLLYFVPSIEGQLVLTIVAGVYFFYLRAKKYAIATLMATLMVLLIFNLKGAGYSIILPRIIDTLIGCGLAWFAVSFIWPDWNFRNISKTMSKSTQATLAYFNAVIEQYQTGRNNGTAYRAARRNAHNAQIELSSMISSLSTEPNPNQALIHTAFRYLVYSHSQLSYVSALGSHREQVNDAQILELLQACQSTLQQALIQHQALDIPTLQDTLTKIQHLSQVTSLSDNLLLALKQISLLLETLPELIKLRTHLLELEIK